MKRSPCREIPLLCKGCFLRFADTGARRSISERSPGPTNVRLREDRLKVLQLRHPGGRASNQWLHWAGWRHLAADTRCGIAATVQRHRRMAARSPNFPDAAWRIDVGFHLGLEIVSSEFEDFQDNIRTLSKK